ncbi:hypothetical protein BKA62DRAFT_744866 [Auriculariales sp. MPI-PUGE-AT-0066]|nr:hypothetical protein BKA62DRAFT_744866 [Auriculariales sp. MPI-PUGE-AT-0066]
MDSSSSKKQKRKAEAEAAPTAVEAAPAPVKKSAAAPAVKEEKKDKRKTKVDKPTSTDEPAPSVKAISNGVVKKLASKKAEAASTKPRRAAAPRKLLVAEDGDEDEEDDEDFAPPADDAEDDDDEAISGSELEENGHLHGFSTDEDSSDDDADMKVDEAPGLDVSQLPTIVKDDATVQRRLAEAKKAAKGSEEDRGVIYLGRIPHGFYEDQMRAYFTQFGTVTRLRLSRNKKTGRSKHYAFIEFDGLKVAEIVADTMDNYLLLGHILQCRVVPKEEVHPQLWVGANRRYRVVPHDRIARLKHNRKRTAEEVVRAEDRLIQRQDAKRRKLAEAGIEYDFGAVAYKKVEA